MLTVRKLVGVVLPILTISVLPTLGGQLTGNILAYGIFKTSEKKLVKTPETPSGYTRIAEDNLVVTAVTNRVPARKGISFGMVYQISGLKMKDGDFIEISEVTKCPAIRKPDGQVCEEFRCPKKLPVHKGSAGSFTGYTFDLDYEMVPGTWTIEIQVNGSPLITRTFTVYKE